jgi:RpiB/LacA/LacB family sugar-phosphate isomerase
MKMIEQRHKKHVRERRRVNMKTVKDKQILVGADFAGFPLKEAVVEHLKKKGWTVTDIGVRSEDDEEKEMFHRIGLKVGAKISEGEFERALIFCGTGMGIHIAASKCPGVHAGVVESVPAALRAITGNGVNVLAMGAFYVAPQMGKDIADAYLSHSLGEGYEWWPNFYEFHKLAIDELDAFDYEKFKANGFEVERLGDYPLELMDNPEVNS